MKVCVIGAGPSGLTTIKQLRDEGHDVLCFERETDIGGIWYRHVHDADNTKAYDAILLTSSIKIMCFSDLMVEGGRKFPNWREYLRYLNEYADKYFLRQYIKFHSTVNHVRRVTNQDWRVSVTSEGRITEYAFEAVALCSGSFNFPQMNVPALHKFTGDILHSSHYRSSTQFTGKRVLIVGLAESGADIVREISDVASQCTLSIRSYPCL
jgi:dimethylaniline monooxygenase (N-oxide forming)